MLNIHVYLTQKIIVYFFRKLAPLMGESKYKMFIEKEPKAGNNI